MNPYFTSVVVHILLRKGSYGHKTLLVALPTYFDKALVKEKVRQSQVYQLADPQTTAVECFEDGAIAFSMRTAQVDGLNKLVDLLRR